MLNKLKDGIMAGIYISIGAVIYLSIENKIIGSMFFAVGILLVLNYHSRLLTKVIPLFFAEREYKVSDIFIALFGNTIGASLIGVVISFTRLGIGFQTSLEKIVNIKLNDSFSSLFIMAIFCGILVGYASITSKKYEKGSFAQIFYVWIFITAFVLCGFDHVIANIFYFANYFVMFGFNFHMIAILLVVLLGNFFGGMLVGIIEKKFIK